MDTQRRVRTSGCNDQTPAAGSQRETAANTTANSKNTKVLLYMHFHAPLLPHFSLMNVFNLLSSPHSHPPFVSLKSTPFTHTYDVQFLSFVLIYFKLHFAFCLVAEIFATFVLYSPTPPPSLLPYFPLRSSNRICLSYSIYFISSPLSTSLLHYFSSLSLSVLLTLINRH